MPEFNKIVNNILVSKPPERSKEILSVFFFDDEGVLNIHAKLVENPNFDIDEWINNISRYDLDW